MQPLGAHVKGVLKAATSKENGPVGVIYGATNSKGEVLVLEAAGKRSIADKADTMTTGKSGNRARLTFRHYRSSLEHD